MLLYIIAIIFCVFFFLSLVLKHPLLQPTAFALYGLTSIVMALILNSNFMPVFIFRYFFYIISGFTILFIPLVIILIALLMVVRSIRPRPVSPFRMVFSFIMAFTMLGFVGLTFWGVLRWSNEQIQEIIGIYSLLALYITTTFLSYISLNFIIDIWSRTRQANLLVVLGSQLDEIDNVPLVLKRRLDKAIKIYHRQQEKNKEKITLIVTGGPQTHSNFSEAEGMYLYLLNQGIPEEDILIESHAQNTYENFVNVKSMIESNNIEGNILVVTSRFHLMRSMFIARQANFKAFYTGASSPSYAWPYSIVREYLAYIILTHEINYLFIVLLIIQGVYSLIL